jgi:hypothetical protein
LSFIDIPPYLIYQLSSITNSNSNATTASCDNFPSFHHSRYCSTAYLIAYLFTCLLVCLTAPASHILSSGQNPKLRKSFGLSTPPKSCCLPPQNQQDQQRSRTSSRDVKKSADRPRHKFIHYSRISSNSSSNQPPLFRRTAESIALVTQNGQLSVQMVTKSRSSNRWSRAIFCSPGHVRARLLILVRCQAPSRSQ